MKEIVSGIRAGQQVIVKALALQVRRNQNVEGFSSLDGAQQKLGKFRVQPKKPLEES